eukprot:m.339462 g.339462  ORF g.339462 m.339462 type:complete len:191 (+) comp16542_c1_seq29:542-1114(+)
MLPPPESDMHTRKYIRTQLNIPEGQRECVDRVIAQLRTPPSDRSAKLGRPPALACEDLEVYYQERSRGGASSDTAADATNRLRAEFDQPWCCESAYRNGAKKAFQMKVHATETTNQAPHDADSDFCKTRKLYGMQFEAQRQAGIAECPTARGGCPSWHIHQVVHVDETHKEQQYGCLPVGQAWPGPAPVL